LARFDSSANCIWVQAIDVNYIFSISTDQQNNVYIAGSYAYSSTFGDTIITSQGSDDIYVAKCNSQGIWKWVRSFGSSEGDVAYSSDVDSEGNIYVAGTFRLFVSFGCEPLTSAGEDDIFILKLDSTGKCLWIRQAGGPGYQYAHSLVVDSKNNCTITGLIVDTCTFGTITLNDALRCYIAQYDDTGDCLWAIETSGAPNDEGDDLAIDGADNIYAVGRLYYEGDHYFGNIPVAGCSQCIFDVKISPLATSNENVSMMNGVRIYPMPISSSALIELPSAMATQNYLTIYDPVGRLLRTIKLISQKTTFEKGDLQPGIYFYQINNDSKASYSGIILVD